MTTPRDFAIALLSGLGLPLTQNNLQALIAFQAQEGGFMHNTANYNPLNSTLPYKGSTVAKGFSTPAIQAYTDWPSGLQATINTLKNGLYNNILAALQASSAPDTTLQAVKNSPFGWYYFLDSQTSSSCGLPNQPLCGPNPIKVPIEPQPSANLQYEANSAFPQGPSTTPLPINPFAQALTAPAPGVGPSVGKAAIGSALIFGIWKLYEFLGKR
jgi:hypothetical protein